MKLMIFVNRLSAFFISLGIYQVLLSSGCFSRIKGWLIYLPLILITLVFIFIFGKVFNGKRKYDLAILLLLSIVGLTMSLFWGHKSFEQNLKSNGGTIVE